MKICLRDFFSTSTVQLDCELGRTNYDSVTSSAGPVGFYAYLGRDRIGLFSVSGVLFLLVNNDVCEAPVEMNAVSHSRQQDVCELRIRTGGRELVIRYKWNTGPISTLFYSEDEEDSDFGIWLRNVLSSEERRRILKESWRRGTHE